MEDTENIQVKPYILVKTIAMTVPTPSKIEITCERIHSEAMEVEEEDLEVSKIQNT